VKNDCNVLFDTLKEGCSSGRLGVDGGIILKWIYRNRMGGHGLDSCELG